MVLDEGHSIKNAKSARFQKLAAVNSSHRLLLSGTPVQNNLKEVSSSLRNDLWSDPSYCRTSSAVAVALHQYSIDVCSCVYMMCVYAKCKIYAEADCK
jgi:SNF2 family DNA or RNA helicase